MRNISFFLTAQQIRDRTKTVTRRRGTFYASALIPGDLFCAVERAQGIKKGGLVRLATCRVVSVRVEALSEMLADERPFDRDEEAREGFPEMTAQQFVDMFCKHMGGDDGQTVTRIEFEYV